MKLRTLTILSALSLAIGITPVLAQPSQEAPAVKKTNKANKNKGKSNKKPTKNRTSENSDDRAPATPIANKPPAELKIKDEYDTIALTAPNLLTDKTAMVAVPTISVSNINYAKTVLVPQTTQGNSMLDVTLIDSFIDDVSPNARHYPPNFPNRTQEHYTKENVRQLVDWLDYYANAANASPEILLRAAKLSSMAKNLDLGPDYSLRASKYLGKILSANPNNAEANFLYGALLSEGGGFTEGKKYLDKAVSLGSIEAEQSLAQADLLNDRQSSALQRLQTLQQNNPNNPTINKQINIIQSGKFYIWDIPDNDINVKPLALK